MRKATVWRCERFEELERCIADADAAKLLRQSAKRALGSPARRETHAAIMRARPGMQNGIMTRDRIIKGWVTRRRSQGA
jgi:hypothetical protein